MLASLIVKLLSHISFLFVSMFYPGRNLFFLRKYILAKMWQEMKCDRGWSGDLAGNIGSLHITFICRNTTYFICGRMTSLIIITLFYKQG